MTVRTAWIVLAAALACCLGPTRLRAALDRASLTNLDVRAAAPRKNLRPEQQNARDKLKQSVPGAAADFDPILETPKWVHAGAGFLTGENGEGKGVSPDTSKRFERDPEKALKGFLHEHRALFRHGPEVLDGAVKKREHATQFMRTVAWEQNLDGIPVFDSVLVAHTTARGELISVSSLFVPEPARAADKGTPQRRTKAARPDVSAERALRLAAENVGEPVEELAANEAQPAPKTLKQSFRIKPLPGDATASLVWFPLDGDTLRLGWDVELTRRERGERFRFVIDAETGAVLLRRKLTVEVSDVVYNVFTSDSPSPFSPGHAVVTNTQPPLVPRQLLAISNVNAAASPLGWINDGVNETRGNNVDAHLDRDADDRADLPRVQGTINGSGLREFNFPIDFAQHPTNYARASVVQLFYWCNWMHDRLYELGFTESVGNFQKDNFGRGGADNDAMIAQAQDGSGFNNANFTPTRDGTPGKVQMFLFNMTNPFRDGSLDAEVILHEYAHGLSDRLIGGGIGISQLQTYGMGEGWSDFFGEALLSEPQDDLGGNYPVGGYLTYQFNGLAANYYYGIRRYPYSTNLNVNPLTFKDIDPTRASSHPGIPRNPIINGSGSEPHRQGEVWCSMLWDMRAFLLRKYAPSNAVEYTNANLRVLRYVTLGLQLSPPNANFVQAREAILQAVRVLQGGTDTNEVWLAFARRGLGASASAPDTSTTVGVFEAFDTPTQPEFDIFPRENITFAGEEGGPFVGGATNTAIVNFGPTNISWSAAVNVPWLQVSPVGGVLAPGATVDCVASLTPFATTLLDGVHPGTVFFTNLSRTQLLTRTVYLTVRSNPPPADPMVLSPTETLSIQGPRGGPFSPVERTQRVANNGATSFWWFASTTNEWLSVSPTNNYVDPGEVQDAVIAVTTNANALPEGTFIGAVTFVNSNTGARVDIPVSLRIGRVDHLTEQFLPTSFDLQNTTLTFTPDFSPDFYDVCRQSALEFPTDPAGGTPVTLADDAFIQIELTNNRQVSLFGVSTNALFIGANGHVTFDPVIDTNYFNPGLNNYFAANRAAALYVDLNPATGGTISYLQLSDRFVVTYENVPEFGVPNVNNAQIEMFYGGAIRMTWLRVDATNTQSIVTGLSRGGGVPADFVQTDLSASEGCDRGATLVLPARAIEGDGSLRGTFLLGTPATNELLIQLESSDPNELIVPEFFIMTNGQSSVRFEMNTVDDGEPDGTQLVTVTATMPDRPPVRASMYVDDAQSSAVYVNVPPSGREGDILFSGGTVRSEMPAVRPLTVSLHSDNTNRARVPSSVVIPAGTNLAHFDIVLPDDNFIQETQSVIITAFVVNWFDDVDVIRVGDNESRALTVTLPASVVEGQGLTNGSITLSGVPTSDVVVSLQSEIPTLLSVPPTVTIAAGKSNVTFNIAIGDNAVINGFDRLSVWASAPGFLTATNSLEFVDDERPFEPKNPTPAHLETNVARDVTLGWSVNSNAPNTTVYEVFLSTNAEALGPAIVSTTNRSTTLPFHLAPNTTYFWRVRASLAPFDPVDSAVWQFTTTPLQFEFGPIASPQFTGEPFEISLRARDGDDLTVTNYAGSLTLTNFAPVKSSSTIVIAEIETSSLRAVEFVNASDRSVNIAGWQIVLYDAQNWPQPTVLYTIPGPSVAPARGLFVLRNLPPPFVAPGAYPNFIFSTNLLWSNNPNDNPVAVMLLDNVGNVVDFACAFDADPARITVPQPVVPAQWSGGPVPPNVDSASTFQRFGNRDSNSSNDWRTARRSTATNNVGLLLPFTNTAPVPFTGTTTIEGFVSGVWTGSVTVLEPADRLTFGVRENTATNAAGASSNPIDVSSRDDVALTLSGPVSALVAERVTYEITVTNSGPNAAADVTVFDAMSNATIAQADPSQGTCALSNGTVRCDLGTVAGGEVATVTIEASARDRGSITNFAMVTRSGADGFAGNNSASAVTTISFPQMAVADATNAEPNGTAFSMVFNVRLTTPYSQTCSVAYATSDGTAREGSDYVATNGVLVFPPGTTNQTVLVPLLPDTLSEATEVYFLTLSNPTNVDFTRPAATGAITDNDPLPQVLVFDTAVTEGNGAPTTATFEVRLNTPSGRTVSAPYATVNGTALAGLDYVETYGSLTFPPGVTNRTITVQILGDTQAEPTKTFGVNLSSAGNAIVGRSPGLGTILDDDVAPLDHFTFDVLPGTNYLGAFVPFTLTARDGNGAVAGDYFGPLPELMASADAREVALGTNGTNWALPFAASFHDARVQSIYLSNELAGAGRIVGLALDVVTAPGQMLSNFTIRLRHTTSERYVGNPWVAASNWTVVAQRDLSLVRTGWTWFTFATPFHYNGRDHLMVDFSFDNASFSTDGICRSSPTANNRSLYLRTDSAYGRPTDWPTDGVANRPPGALIARVPNLRLLVDDEVPVNVVSSNGFVSGVWSGAVQLLGAADRLVLRAVDAEGRSGESDRITSIALRIVGASRRGNDVAIAVETLEGYSYVLQASAAATGPWSEAATKLGTGTVIEFLHTPESDPQFYRVRLGP